MLQQKVNDESTYSNPPIGHPGLLMGNAEVWLKPRELRASRESNIVQWSWEQNALTTEWSLLNC